MTANDSIQYALDETNRALDELLYDLVKKYPSLGPAFFAGCVARRATFIVAYREGIHEARAITGMGITDCLDLQQAIKAQRNEWRWYA